MSRKQYIVFLFGFAKAFECTRNDVTISGRKCQNWSHNYPHIPNANYAKDKYHNFCTAADPLDQSPWCYTTDPNIRWEICTDVCAPSYDIIQPVYERCDRTANGYNCQRWDTNFPHIPNFMPSNNNHNFCWSRPGDGAPWCYTTDQNQRWDYCDSYCKPIGGPQKVITTRTTTTTRRATTTRPTTTRRQSRKPHHHTGYSGAYGKPTGNRNPSHGHSSHGHSSHGHAYTDIKCTYSKIGPNRNFTRHSCYAHEGQCLENCEDKIIHGQEANSRAKFPWFVLVDEHCGGSLISRQYVVTAAHCVKEDGGKGPKKQPGFQLMAGSRVKYESQFNSNDRARAQIRKAEKIITHPDYNPQGHKNDIALIMTDREFKLTDYVQPVNLPPSCDHIPQDGEFGHRLWVGYGLVAGFGQKENGLNSYHLLWAKVEMHQKKYCRSTAIAGMMDFDDKTMICAGGHERDTCQGDSGGPLVIEVNNIGFALAGITSFGIGCGKDRYPGVYTNVSKYRKWICNVEYVESCKKHEN